LPPDKDVHLEIDWNSIAAAVFVARTDRLLHPKGNTP
jgi:hypothetical protein